ncbi:MAG: hypothetical protein H0W85_02990 [Methylotenera sp.]|nr:hypothetical protein [Methylotenera sp.]
MKRNLKEKGVVLFISLIALVVMSLAAVALIRAVDTNSLITGNLSYRQTATISSSYGIESVSDFLGPQATTYGDANHPTLGYYAVCTTFDVNPLNDATQRCTSANLTVNNSWQPGITSTRAVGSGITGGVDAYGNTIEYIVERMCPNVGSATQECVAAQIKKPGSQKGCDEPTCPLIFDEQTPLYRITVRITGPKNTVSYVQTFIS